MKALKLSLTWTFYLLFLHTTEEFYLPGLAPISYCDKQHSIARNCESHIPLFVNRLDSEETLIPYEYSRFDFCSPNQQDYAPSENLGQVVSGERIQPSAYNFDNTIKWASRWDYILESNPHRRMQWFSITCSLVIVVFLSGVVTMLMLRILQRKDTALSNQLESSLINAIMDNLRYRLIFDGDVQKKFAGWKLVHGDVFRAPGKRMLLSVMLGTGTQVVTMTSITLVIGCLGFLSPANRGALMTTVLVLFVCLGGPAGYVSARMYKLFGGGRWKTNALMTCFLFPGVIFGIICVLNLILWTEMSSAVIPLRTLGTLVALWFGISVPMVFFGAYFGFRKPVIELPLRTNQTPRQIPKQSFYCRGVSGMIMAGILPFFCIFLHLFFVLSSIWSHQIFYGFGFLLLVSTLLIIIVSETCILHCYYHLRAENYHWWWRSYLTGAFTAVYIFLYSIYYFHKLTIVGTTSSVLYFGYTSIMFMLSFLYTGTVGFFACFFFVRKIYGAVEVDYL